jgi:hypothetical protein
MGLSHSHHGEAGRLERMAKYIRGEADDVEWRERPAQVDAPVTATNTRVEVAESHGQRRLVGGVDEDEAPIGRARRALLGNPR